MSHVDFKKKPCCDVEFRSKEPLPESPLLPGPVRSKGPLPTFHHTPLAKDPSSELNYITRNPPLQLYYSYTAKLPFP